MIDQPNITDFPLIVEIPLYAGTVTTYHPDKHSAYELREHWPRARISQNPAYNNLFRHLPHDEKIEHWIKSR
jgi:hypothetical protein